MAFETVFQIATTSIIVNTQITIHNILKLDLSLFALSDLNESLMISKNSLIGYSYFLTLSHSLSQSNTS